jgi:tetratricopeptide (TPR) repeat protein
MVGGNELDDTIESLRRKGLLIGGDGALDELAFRHLLIRDAAYGSLPKSERAALHDKFGVVLEQQAGDAGQFTEILAHHAERAFTLSNEVGMRGDLLVSRALRAVEWSLAMADRARTRHEVRVVDSALSVVRSAIAVLPDGGGLKTRARIRLLEAQMLLMKADYGAAGQAAAEAGALGDEAGLLSLVAAARLTAAWIINWTGEGAMKDFEYIFKAAVDACRRAGDQAGEIEARHLWSNVQFAAGRLQEFIEINERLVEQARATKDVAREATITERMVNVETMRGNAHLAERNLRNTEALATNYGFRGITTRLMHDRGVTCLSKGDLAGAEYHFRQYETAAREAGAVQQHIGALRFVGYTLISAGRFAEAAHAIDQAIELSEATGETWNRSELLGLRALAALNLGDLELSENFIERALATVREGDIAAVSEVNKSLGLLRAAQGRYAEAEAALRRSLQVVVDTEYLNMKTPAALALGLFLAKRGKFDEARSLCDEYAELTEELGWKGWKSVISAIRGLIAAGQPARDT